MTDIGELTGPKVYADKNQTADSGGGYLRVTGGVLFIQGAVHSRKVGALTDLEGISFQDISARHALFNFRDGNTWTVMDESDGQLLPFARELAGRLGLPSLVMEAPSPREQVKRFLTRERWLELAGVAAALGLALLVRLLVARAAPVGYVLGIAVIAWLVVLAASRQRTSASSLPPGRLQNVGWVSGIALPLGVLLGCALGIVDAAAQARLDARAEATEQAAEAERQAAQAEAKAKAERTRLRILTLIKEMHQAMAEEQWREAEQRYTEAKSLAPEHTELRKAWGLLEPRLQQLDEEERRVKLLTGISDARRIAADPVLCDSAKDVADAWKRIRVVGPEDEEWSEARSAASKLESCRKRVERSLSANVSDVRRQERARSVAHWQRRLRSRGFDVSVQVEGRRSDVLSVRLDQLDDATADSLTESGSKKEGSLLWQLEKAGMRALVLKAGRSRARRYELSPQDEAELGKTVLEGLGLDKPLGLGG